MTTPESPPISRRGFTLLEVLLAVLVLGVSLTVFFGAANQGLSLVTQAQTYADARTLLNRLRLVEPIDFDEFEEGETGGVFDGGDLGRVEWTRTVTLEGKEEDEFYRLETRIEWGQRTARHEESTETFLHLPTAKEGGWVKEPVEE